MKKQSSNNKLHGIAQFVLFVTSYSPLFILICLKQVYGNRDFIYWGGFDLNSLTIFIQKFGLSFFLILLSCFGFLGCFWLFKNLEKDSKNGENVTIIDINNRNSESIGYIATYIVPFLFQNFNDWYEIVAFLFLIAIIYRIYINSNLLIVNPLLSFRYSIFEMEYETQSGKRKRGLVISKEKVLDENEIIKIYSIGHKLYYASLRKP
ncbi:MAG: hypothetical protein RBS73_11175 [Prolixibacteraceae bacterium]|jgi:cbb3-type cytochrome oxidase subunit 3|nr:hypothetical protein [Prolixibacteraceae bacterium]